MIGLFHLSHLDLCETYGMGNLKGSSQSLPYLEASEITEYLRGRCFWNRQETEAVLEVKQPNKSKRRW